MTQWVPWDRLRFKNCGFLVENCLLERAWCFSPGWGSLVLPHLCTCTDSFWISGPISSPSYAQYPILCVCIQKAFLSSDNSAYMSMPLWTLDPSSGVLRKDWVLPNHAVRVFMRPVPRCYARLPLLSKGPFGMVEHDPKQTHLSSLRGNTHPLQGWQ